MKQKLGVALAVVGLSIFLLSLYSCGAAKTAMDVAQAVTGSGKPAETKTVGSDKEIKQAVKEYVSTSGSFKKLQKDVTFVVPQFNVEYAYKKYTARVGETSKVGNIQKTVIADGYRNMRLEEEDYRNITDALYASFVSALEEYAGKKAVSRETMVNHPEYAELGGKEKDDTADHFFSIRRGGNVQTGDKGAETVTLAPRGMKVLGMKAAFKAATAMAHMAGELGADMIINVTLYVDIDKKTDTPMIRTADVRILSDMRKREKKVPFTGVVPGEYVYEYYGAQNLGLKEPVSTNVKVTDRRTGFFEQVSGTYKIDTNAMAEAIVQTYQSVAILQAIAASGKY